MFDFNRCLVALINEYEPSKLRMEGFYEEGREEREKKEGGQKERRMDEGF